MSPSALLAAGLDMAQSIQDFLVAGAQSVMALSPFSALSISARYCTVATYLGAELGSVLAKAPEALGRTRMLLSTDVDPLCLHLGIVRLGTKDALVLDLIYDTTDSQLSSPLICVVAFEPLVAQALAAHTYFKTLRPLLHAY